MFDLENLGQGHREQLPQWFHSMANINVNKIIIEHCLLDSYRFPGTSFSNLSGLEKIRQGYDMQHSQWHHSTANT